jgi:hypothetical protein
MSKQTGRQTTESAAQQVKKSKGQVSSVVESVVINDTEPNQQTTKSVAQQEKNSKGQVSSVVESVVVNDPEPNDVVVVVEDVDGVGVKTTNSPTSFVPNEKIPKVQDLLSVFLHEKESVSSCKKQVALAGREHDAASQGLRKSQTDHSIAVAKHDKLQGELRLKSMMVELVRSAWERAKFDAGMKGVVDNESSDVSKATQCAVTPERKK